MAQLTSKGSSESDFSLFLCCEKSSCRIFFILRTVMVDTSLYSKMVRKVKLIYVDLLFYWLETAPEERCFPRLESQNKPSLAETWLIFGTRSSRERETLHKTKNCLFMAGIQCFSPGDIQFQLVYDRGQCAETSYLGSFPHIYDPVGI